MPSLEGEASGAISAAATDSLPSPLVLTPTAPSPVPDSLMTDLAALLNMGLHLSDVERMWQGLPSFDLAAMHDAGARLLGSREVHVERQLSLGMELVRIGQPSSKVVPELVAQLQAESTRHL
jgi:hypothetical protein